ncbi:MAG: sensor histidine kinase [Terriglobia bacterium]
MPAIRDLSITTKLTWMNLLVSAAALLLACAAFVAYDLMAFRTSMVRALSIQAQIVGSNCASALLFNDPHAAESTLAALKAAPHIITAAIYTSGGKPFARYWRERPGLAQPLLPMRTGQVEFHQFEDRQLTLVRSIVFQGQPVGFVCIRSDLGEMNSRLKSHAGIVGMVLAASLLAALLISSVFRRVIADRIVHLADTARMVYREKNYSVRASDTGSHDEIAILIEAFNEMLSQIQERDGALQSAQERLERRVEERTAQLTAANKELEAFSYSVSHDLRAPLRQIDGFAQVLADQYGPQLEPTAQNYLQWIRNGAKNMGELVDDLLKMGWIGRQELAFKSTDLNLLVQGVLRDLQPQCDGRQIDWEIGTLPTLECDPALMKVVFANLLSNAVKYTRRRECAVIQIGHKTEEGVPVIFVRDNGAGFEQQYAHKLFGVFQRLHRSDEFEGTGVGLATVQRIIQKHGGRVWGEGEFEKGATFFLILPKLNPSISSTQETPFNEVTYDAH